MVAVTWWFLSCSSGLTTKLMALDGNPRMDDTGAGHKGYGSRRTHGRIPGREEAPRAASFHRSGQFVFHDFSVDSLPTYTQQPGSFCLVPAGLL